jgi:hypothetical protein
MQKVVGSSPIIRSLVSPAPAGFLYVGRIVANRVGGFENGAGAHWCPISALDQRP